MRISDWSSDVCSSDLCVVAELTGLAQHGRGGLFPIRGGVLVLGTGQAQGVLGGVRIRARSHGSHNRESRDLGPLDVRSPIWWPLDDHRSCTCPPGHTRPPHPRGMRQLHSSPRRIAIATESSYPPTPAPTPPHQNATP